MLADRVRIGSKTGAKMINIKVYAVHQWKPSNSRIAFFPIIKEFKTWTEVANNPSIYLGNPVDVTNATYTTPIAAKTLGIDKVIWGYTTGYVVGYALFLNGTQMNSSVSSVFSGNYLGFSELRRWQSPTNTPLIEGDIVGTRFDYD